jgi:hypothetical protein
MPKRKEIGRVISGSLLTGLEIKLAEEVSVEDITVGRLVVVEGQTKKFFSILKDVALASTSQDILLNPPNDIFSQEIHLGVNTYFRLTIQPMLIIEKQEQPGYAPRVSPSTTVPPHFSPVYEAGAEDVAQVFGSPSLFSPEIGAPLFMEVPICLNLERFIMRSNAIFGKTGSGKSVLARMLLGHLIKSNLAVNLIFDMHNEYGWTATTEDGKLSVPSLKRLLGQQVAIFTLDPGSALYSQVRPDYEVEIAYGQIEIGDLELIQGELGISQAGIDTMYRLSREWGEDKWLERFLATPSADLAEIAEKYGLHQQALEALSRKLSKLKQFSFLKKVIADDTVTRIKEFVQANKHIVLQFGRYNNLLCYILVANILTRRLHKLFVEETDRARAEKRPLPRPLIVTIEEAHKFLAPEIASQTIFGTIAREMRKYNMTLLLIDQRPSGIDDEILSQVGTRVIGELGDEKDISAVLTGLPNQSTLKVLINNLEPRQFLLAGHALPMPVVIESKNYQAFCKELEISSGKLVREVEQRKEELYGSDLIEL